MRVKLKKRSAAVQIFPPNSPPLKEMVDGLLKFPHELARVQKAKKYLECRLQGKGKTESKREAGFPITNNTEEKILSNPVIKTLLNELVIKEITDPQVVNRLREMWDADTKRDVYDPVTKTVLEVKQPHWEMRKYAMDKRLALGGYTNGNLPENGGTGAVVTQIKFTTINVNSSGKSEGNEEALRAKNEV